MADTENNQTVMNKEEVSGTNNATTTGTEHGHHAHQRHGHLNALPGGYSEASAGALQPGLWKPFEHRKLANPAPLGLSAFALTTFVLSAINMHARGVVAPNIMVTLAFGYGGLVQLLAGMW